MDNSLLADPRIIEKCTPIRFVGGKYKSKMGWLDPTRKLDGNRIPIIINVPSKGGLYQTSVEGANIRMLTGDDHAMTFTEAVFLVPDVEVAIVEACRKIVKFDISKDENGVEGFKEQFGKELLEAQEWQENKGSKAQWRRCKDWEQQFECRHA